MRLQAHKLHLDWPNELPVDHLRSWLLSEIKKFGVPLRWAITDISHFESDDFRKITLEFVVVH